MKEYIIKINNGKNSIKKSKELHKINSLATNGIKITKEINYDNFKVVSLCTEDENDKYIIEQFAGGDENIIIEENQVYKIQNIDLNLQDNLKNRVLRFLDRIYSFFFPQKLDIYSLNNINYPEYDLPVLFEKKYNDPHSEQWGVVYSRCKFAWEKGYTGENIKVAVLDSGLQVDHKALKNRVQNPKNTVGSGQVTDTVEDKNTHGTHVSGIVGAEYQNIFGIAPQCTIIPIKVLGDDGNGNLGDIIQGIHEAINLKVDVINMSLGGGGYSKIFEDALIEAYNKNIIILAASGNENSDVSYPAKYQVCIPIGAYNKINKICYFSNHSSEMEKGLVAPGEDILSCGTKNDFKYMSGTSMATPAAAGAAAILKQINKALVTPEIAREALNMGAIKLIGVDQTFQGNGKLDIPNSVFKCLELLKENSKVHSLNNIKKIGIGCRGFIVEKIQTCLAYKKLYSGKIDGIFGKKTEQAVLDFTKNKNYIDEEVYHKLSQKDFFDIFERSLQITSSFEGTGFTQLVGNFDGTYLTWGIIGFTLLHKEIPNILLDTYRDSREILINIFKDDYQEMKKLIEDFESSNNISNFKKWALRIQSTNAIFDKYKFYFKELGESGYIKQIQINRARKIYWDRALSLVSEFKLKEDLSLALCFDCSVQGFNQNGLQKAIALTGRDLKSALLESNNYGNESEIRKLIAIANSETCNPRWKKDVWSRKSTFIKGTGHVHGMDYDLSNWGL